MVKATFCFFVLFILHIKASKSIDCYRCVSHNGTAPAPSKSCGYPFENGDLPYVKNCMDNTGGGSRVAHYCMKIVQTFESRNEVKIIRDCTATSYQQGCETKLTDGDWAMSCVYLCDRDGCNGSNNVLISVTLLAFTLFVSCFKAFY